MKIPAIRAKMGDWTYYITTLTFDQVAEYVSAVNEELHKSESLKDLIQRSITSNYRSIKQYILQQPELFFNSLVLAVYDEYPNWRQIEVMYDDFKTHQLGVLEFPGKHKIFALDGQHRVEGIKAALLVSPELGSQAISAIFVGHKNSLEGMRRSRRLFSTLNRYAKPVTMDDIIALDEDDSIAVVTRSLLEDFGLFTGKRVTKSESKAIPDSDKSSITSIITLYQCNRELIKLFRKIKNKSSDRRDNRSLAEYLKFRPEDGEIEAYQLLCEDFWNSLSANIPALSAYLQDNTDKPAEPFRNRESGGHLLFRPVGLLPFVQAAIEIHTRTGQSFDRILGRLGELDMTINKEPWKFVLWNPVEQTMIMNTSSVVKLLLVYLYGQGVIRPNEISSLKEKYAGKLNVEGDDIAAVLSRVIPLS